MTDVQATPPAEPASLLRWYVVHAYSGMEKAVERMLPKESPLARKQMTHLRLFAGSQHDHEAQQPETIDFKSASPKNTRSV